MLSDDVVVWTDGGGKVRAAMRPVVGPYRSSRFLLNVAKKLQGVPQATVLNGQPATVFVEGGVVVAALVLDILDGSIVGVRAVTNPDKLERLTARLPSGAPTTWPDQIRSGPVRTGPLSGRVPLSGRRSLFGVEGVELSPPDLARSRAGKIVDEDQLLRGRPGRDAVRDDLPELLE